jgi:hypothetical protein
MSTDWREEWVGAKVTVATRLGSGDCGGGYAEAAIILCGVLSAMAAEKWPGHQKDKKRFVELLYQYADTDLYATRISVPLLIAFLKGKGRLAEQMALGDAYMPISDTRVLTGDDVDKSEEELITLCPTLEQSLVRRFSYATLLYEDTRSSYAHEYMPGPRSDSWAMGSTRAKVSVSYTNRMNMELNRVDRLIHFSVSWLADLALSIEKNIRPLVPDNQFSAWWLPTEERSASQDASRE